MLGSSGRKYVGTGVSLARGLCYHTVPHILHSSHDPEVLLTEATPSSSSSSGLQAYPLYEAYWLGCVCAFCGISVQEKKVEKWIEQGEIGQCDLEMNQLYFGANLNSFKSARLS